jgi:hypothetical protein
MAFETAQTKIRAVGRAGNVLGLLRTIYAHMDELQTMLATYQAGTDPALNAALNAVYTAGERTEFGDALPQLLN